MFQNLDLDLKTHTKIMETAYRQNSGTRPGVEKSTMDVNVGARRALGISIYRIAAVEKRSRMPNSNESLERVEVLRLHPPSHWRYLDLIVCT